MHYWDAFVIIKASCKWMEWSIILADLRWIILVVCLGIVGCQQVCAGLKAPLSDAGPYVMQEQGGIHDALCGGNTY